MQLRLKRQAANQVQQQSAATASDENRPHPTCTGLLICVNDLQRPSCLSMVRRRSTVYLSELGLERKRDGH